MYHSITFGNKNTWTDWHIVPTSRPVIVPPKPKTKYVDVPGADGSIDLTESLAGRSFYSDREGSIEFVVLNDFNVDNYKYSWSDVYMEILAHLHGKRMTMILEDDPNYYYEGRFMVDSWSPDDYNSKITISYRLNPYKFTTDYLYLPIDFESGYYDANGDPQNSTLNIRTKASSLPRQVRAGDLLHFDGRYTPTIIEYTGTASSPVFLRSTTLTHTSTTKAVVWQFTDALFYRFYAMPMGGTIVVGDYTDLANTTYVYRQNGGTL